MHFKGIMAERTHKKAGGSAKHQKTATSGGVCISSWHPTLPTSDCNPHLLRQYLYAGGVAMVPDSVEAFIRITVERYIEKGECR